jgi:hypothetical protein
LIFTSAVAAAAAVCFPVTLMHFSSVYFLHIVSARSVDFYLLLLFAVLLLLLQLLGGAPIPAARFFFFFFLPFEFWFSVF